MSMFSGIMASSCMVISPGSVTIDSYGQETPGTPVETGPYRCYFFQPTGDIINLSSGEHQKKALRLMLPASVTVTTECYVRGLSTGYSDTYRVMSVEPASCLDVLDHWECDLEVVQ